VSSKSVNLLHSEHSIVVSEVDSEDSESEDDEEGSPLPVTNAHSSGIITYNETSSDDEDEEREKVVGYSNVRNPVKETPDEKSLLESNTSSDDSSAPPPRPSKQVVAKQSLSVQQFDSSEDSDSSPSSSSVNLIFSPQGSSPGKIACFTSPQPKGNASKRQLDEEGDELDMSDRTGNDPGFSERTSFKKFDLNHDRDDKELNLSSKGMELLHSEQSVLVSEDSESEGSLLPIINARSSRSITYNETSSNDEDEKRGQAVGCTNVRNSVKKIPDETFLLESDTSSDASSAPPRRPSKQVVWKQSSSTQQFHGNEDSDSSSSSS